MRVQSIPLHVLAAVFSFTVSSHAETFCVTTSAQLQNALTSVSDGGAHDAEDNLIKVVTGTYPIGVPTTNGPFHFDSTQSAYELRIAGGFSPGCTSRTLDASRTVIDGANQSGAMDLRSANGAIGVGYITFTRGNSTSPGAGLSVNAEANCSPNHCLGAVALEHNIIQRNHSAANCGGLAAVGNPLRVEGNLMDSNSSAQDAGGACVESTEGNSEVYGNTVASNATPSGSNKTGGLECTVYGAPPSACEVSGNIFWDNTNFGLYLGNPGALLLDNDYGARGGAAPASELGDLDEDPHFASTASLDYHLSSASTLFGRSSFFLQGYDLDGYGYPTAGGQDMGAYETTVFVNGLDAN